MSGLDLDRLVAIDVHVHVEADGHGHYALDDELRAAASKYFKGDPYHPTVPQIAADYHSQAHQLSQGLAGKYRRLRWAGLVLFAQLVLLAVLFFTFFLS